MDLQPYIDLAERIRDEVTDVKNIDLFNDQYNRSKTEHPYTTPAVWIEFLPVQWNGATAGVQEGIGGVRIHCEVEMLKDTRDLDTKPVGTMNYIKNKMAFAARVHAAVQGFAVSNWTPFERVQTMPDQNHDKNIIEILEYQCSVYDDTAFPYGDYVEAEPELAVPGEIVTPPGEELGDY